MDADENILVLADEDGNDVPFQILDEIDLNDRHYVVLVALDDEDGGVLIFRVSEDEDGNEAFEPEDDDAMQQRVLDTFIVDDEGNSYSEEDFVPAE